MLGGVDLSASFSLLWRSSGMLQLFLRVTWGQGVWVKCQPVRMTPTFSGPYSSHLLQPELTTSLLQRGQRPEGVFINCHGSLFLSWIKINFLYRCWIVFPTCSNLSSNPRLPEHPSNPHNWHVLFSRFGVHCLPRCWQKSEEVGTTTSFSVDNLKSRLTNLSKCHRTGQQKGSSGI